MIVVLLFLSKHDFLDESLEGVLEKRRLFFVEIAENRNTLKPETEHT